MLLRRPHLLMFEPRERPEDALRAYEAARLPLRNEPARP